MTPVFESASSAGSIDVGFKQLLFQLETTKFQKRSLKKRRGREKREKRERREREEREKRERREREERGRERTSGSCGGKFLKKAKIAIQNNIVGLFFCLFFEIYFRVRNLLPTSHHFLQTC